MYIFEKSKRAERGQRRKIKSDFLMESYRIRDGPFFIAISCGNCLNHTTLVQNCKRDLRKVFCRSYNSEGDLESANIGSVELFSALIFYDLALGASNLVTCVIAKEEKLQRCQCVPYIWPAEEEKRKSRKMNKGRDEGV